MKNISIEEIESCSRELNELSYHLISINDRVGYIIDSLNENGSFDYSVKDKWNLNNKMSLIDFSRSLRAISDSLIRMVDFVNYETQMNAVYAPPKFMGDTEKLEK